MLQWRLTPARRQCLHHLRHPLRPVQQSASTRRRRPSRSKALYEALQADPESPYARPPIAHPKPDLSYVSYRDATQLSSSDRKRLSVIDQRTQTAPTLQDVLAKYIVQKRTGALQHDDLLDEQSMLFLHDQGYSIAHIRRWAAILSESDAIVDAADQFVLSLSDDKPIPLFVFMQLLRRQNLPADALKQLLHYAWHLVRDRQRYSLNDSTAMLMIVRLLRHCRLTWPEAIVTLTRLYIEFFTPNQSSSSDDNHEYLARQVDRANRFLALLALPIPQGPLLYVPLQQRAQFDLLEWMATFEPPLAILRRGYRAIIQTQLGSAKTAQDRDWALLKAKTWPPWKSDRTGLDAEKGQEYGTSGALQAIQRAREAGYGSETWEDTAQVLSGWNLDNSPTIQTRAILLHNAVSAKHSRGSRRNSPSTWAAKVRATRTVNEAWAAFLSWRKLELPANSMIYVAMLEKIHAEDKRNSSPNSSINPNVLPGDTKDVWPVSDSPKESVYVPEPPPPFNELVLEMFTKGCFPHGPSLSFLVSHAPSLEDGCSYIRLAAEKENAFLSLLNDAPHREQRLGDVPLHLLQAFVQLCARFAFVVPAPIAMKHKTFSFGSTFPLLHALRLLMRRNPAWRPPWYTVLSALALRPHLSAPKDIDSPRRMFQTLDRYRTMLAIRKQMKNLGLDIDVAGILYICRGLEFAVVAANQIRAHPSQRLQWSNHDLRAMADGVLNSGFGYIRGLFYALFGTHDARKIRPPQPEDLQSLQPPALLAVPRPHVLHAYARVVGLLRNWPGLLELARWLATHHESIRAAAHLTPGGPQMLRRVVVALRVFAEVGWSVDDDAAASAETAPGSTIDKLRDTLSVCGDWGIWPDDDEVEEYCAKMYKIM